MRKSRKELVPTLEMFPLDPNGNVVNVLTVNRVTHFLGVADIKKRIEANLGQVVKPEVLSRAAANLRSKQARPETNRMTQARLELCFN